MPVYEYICKACDHEFEREQRISDNPIKKCPECGSMKAKRLISRTSFVLKGGGWYSDLYSSSRGNAGASEGKSESSSGSDSDSKADSKPASSTKPAKESKASGAKGSKAAA
jgi:putative FmdB family regulatory protein